MPIDAELRQRMEAEFADDLDAYMVEWEATLEARMQAEKVGESVDWDESKVSRDHGRFAAHAGISSSWEAPGKEGHQARKQASRELLAAHRAKAKELLKADVQRIMAQPGMKELDAAFRENGHDGLARQLAGHFKTHHEVQTDDLKDSLAFDMAQRNADPSHAIDHDALASLMEHDLDRTRQSVWEEMEPVIGELEDESRHEGYRAALHKAIFGGAVHESAEWDESKHPRDHGKFSSKPGASGDKKSKPSVQLGFADGEGGFIDVPSKQDADRIIKAHSDAIQTLASAGISVEGIADINVVTAEKGRGGAYATGSGFTHRHNPEDESLFDSVYKEVAASRKEGTVPAYAFESLEDRMIHEIAHNIHRSLSSQDKKRWDDAVAANQGNVDNLPSFYAQENDSEAWAESVLAIVKGYPFGGTASGYKPQDKTLEKLARELLSASQRKP